MKLNYFILVLSILIPNSFITISCTTGSVSPKQKHSTVLWFSYLSIAVMGGEHPRFKDWDKPRPFALKKSVGFEFLNDSTLVKLGRNSNGEKKVMDTLKKLNRKLKNMDALVTARLDYKLLGVYLFNKMPDDCYTVLYYSKARKSLISESHISEINRIGDVIIFMDTPDNPFSAKPTEFKLLAGKDTMYHEEFILKRLIRK